MNSSNLHMAYSNLLYDCKYLYLKDFQYVGHKVVQILTSYVNMIFGGLCITADLSFVNFKPQGIGHTAQGQYAPALPGGGLAQPRPTGMQPVPVGGPHDPSHSYGAEDEETVKLRAARAGGWTVELSKKRALEEAFSSIWI